jgi:arylsulfatase A-like enzyme
MKPPMSSFLPRQCRFVLVAIVSCIMIAVTHAAAPSRPPNIVIFFADDLGWGECGFQGLTRDVPTPHTDQIAKNGIRFTNGYVAATYCSPSRAGLMTGRYPTRFGHEYNGNGPEFGLPKSERTMADHLKALGYATCAVGKWHLGDQPGLLPTDRGFDEYMGVLGNPGSYSKPSKWVDSLKLITPGKDFYTTDAFADRSVDWIKRNRERPFFLYLPFNAEHAPLEAPERYLARFSGIADLKRRTFAAMLSAMDDAIGRVTAALREHGLEENTLIVFLSDNGGATPSNTAGNGPLRGLKMTTNEGGTRVPFAIQWKEQLPAGKVYELPIIQLDLLPTLLAAAGGKIDPSWKLDGVNLLPYLNGKDTSRPHDTLYWRFGPQWAIRDGDWKLVASRIDQNQPRLINLATDIAEAHDLSAAEPERVRALTAKWQAWSAEQREPLWVESAGAKGGKKKAGKKGAKKDV